MDSSEILEPVNSGKLPDYLEGDEDHGTQNFPLFDPYVLFIVEKPPGEIDPIVKVLAVSYTKRYSRMFAESVALKAIYGSEWDFSTSGVSPVFDPIDPEDGSRKELPKTKFMMWDGAFEDRRSGVQLGYEDTLVAYDGSSDPIQILFKVIIARSQMTNLDFMATKTDADRAFEGELGDE